MNHALRSLSGALMTALLFALNSCCTPCPCCGVDLVVSGMLYDPVARTVTVSVENQGSADAGAFLTYLEINQVSAPSSAKPESQSTHNQAGLAAGDSVTIGPIALSSFSARPTIDLNTITNFELVVTADPKSQVDECDEGNNQSTQEF